jgi:hypothetical protein
MQGRLSVDREFKMAVEAGERNRSTMELVRNWCSHARVEKFGGTGMVEQVTGLPIGNHGLKCDHAIAGGMYTWDLRDAALDFYDRNCVDCKKRKAVGVPNLSMLVKERDDRRAVEAKKALAEQSKEAHARDARKLTRSRLREGLSPLSGAIIDHIDEFDEQRDQEHRDRLCESARMAPEHFVTSVVAYVFELTEREPWFVEAGLTILDHVQADPARIARLALAPMGKVWPIDTHARILVSRLPHVDAAQIPDALPAIIELASPFDELPFGPDSTAPPRPELLQGLWATYPTAVREGLDRLLSSRRHYEVELGARGLLVLHERDPAVLKHFQRAMVSKFSRAELLLDNFDEYHSAFRFLRDALVIAFTQWSDEIDELVQEYILASDKKSKARAYKIYEAAHRGGRHDDPPIPPESRVHRISFQRLLWAATTEESEEILRCAQEMFRGQPYEMVEIARAEIDGLIGAVLLLDDRLRRHDEAPVQQGGTFLDTLERSNRRSTIVYLMKSLIEWASIAAKGDLVLMKKVVALFDQIPEGRNDLKGIALGCIEHLSGTVEGLKLVLPHLYYGLVGPSALVRAYAADALGEMPHENIPPLVFEAFSVLLWDQYIVVHHAAVRALGRFHLPEDLRARASQALLHLVKYYSQKSNEDHFLVECIGELAYELRRLNNANGNVGQYLVKVLLNVDPLYLKNEIRSIGRALGQTEGFADVLIKLVPYVDGQDHRRDDELALLAELPEEAIRSRKAAFEKLGREVAPERPWLAAYIVEALARAGAWHEARAVAEAGSIQLEPTVYNESRRIYMTFVRITTAFEEAIAEGRRGDLEALMQQWEENAERQKEFNADVERRNSRSGFSRPR